MSDYISLFLDDLLLLFAQLAFCGIPLASMVIFIVSLYRYIAGWNRNKRNPDRIDVGKIKELRIQLINASIIAGGFAIIIIALMVLLSKAVARM